MPFKKPTALTKPPRASTAGTKLASGVPELNVVRRSEPDDGLPTDIELPAELPGELTALASQLQSDAARLAQLYPPSARPVLFASRPAAIHVIPRRLGVAAAVLLIGVLTAWQFLPRHPPANRPQSSLNVLNSHEGRLSLRESTSFRGAKGDQPGHFQSGVGRCHDSAESADLPATYSIAELTGPELEALVDLMQRDARDSSAIQRVSF